MDQGSSAKTHCGERYWAVTDRSELIGHLNKAVEDFYDEMNESGRIELYRRSVMAFRGLDPHGSWAESSAVQFGGQQGELAMVNYNHYRSVLMMMHALITGTRPAIKARAVTDTTEAKNEARLAQQLIEWDMHHTNLEEALRKTALHALVYGEGWLYQVWDDFDGEAVGVDPEDDRVIHRGGIVTVPLRPLDVIRDPMEPFEGDDRLDWVIVRRKVNRYRLIAKYPQFEQELLEATPASMVDDRKVLWNYSGRGSGVRTKRHDHVWLYEFFHNKTPEALLGRQCCWVDSTILHDSKLLYERIPVHAMIPDFEDGTPFGSAHTHDLLGPQQVLNSAVTTVLSNHDAFGNQIIWTMKGDDLKFQSLQGGLKHVQSEVKPEPIQLLRIAEDSYRIINNAIDTMQTLSGINSVSRGDPQESLKTGSALALVQSMSVQAQTAHQSAYVKLIENVTSTRIQIKRDFVTEQQAVEIVGAERSFAVREWKGADLGRVSRMTAELVNPLMQTTQGKMEIADSLLERGMIKNVGQYIEILTTGRSESTTKPDDNQMGLIEKENALIMQGRPAQALFTHNHPLHIQQHAAILNSPESLDNPMIVQLLRAHLEEHMMLLEQVAIEKPEIAEMIGYPIPEALMMRVQAQQAAMAAGGAMPPPPEGALPPGADMPDAGSPEIPEAPVQEMPGLEFVGSQAASMPNMPENPLTGNRLNIPTVPDR